MFEVINNPNLQKFSKRSGFRNHEFKHLAGLFSWGSSRKLLFDMAVDVDFEEKTCTVTYYRSNAYVPYLQFIVRQVGPKTDMYELYMEEKGRIMKSGLFSRAYERLKSEVESLTDA